MHIIEEQRPCLFCVLDAFGAMWQKSISLEESDISLYLATLGTTSDQ